MPPQSVLDMFHYICEDLFKEQVQPNIDNHSLLISMNTCVSLQTCNAFGSKILPGLRPIIRQSLLADVIQVQMKVFTFKCFLSTSSHTRTHTEISSVQTFLLRTIEFWSSDKLQQNSIIWSRHESLCVCVCISAFIWSSQRCFTLI